MDHLEMLGPLALASRLKRLSERLMQEVGKAYVARYIDFEPAWFPLFSLVLERSPISLTEAADALGLSHAAISQQARILRKQGWLELTAHPEDQRSKLLSLTKDGALLAEKLGACWHEMRAVVEDVLREIGSAPLLEQIGKLEVLIEQKHFSRMMAERARALAYDAVTIVPYEAKYRPDFERFNRVWLEKDFAVEAVDDALFADPEGLILSKGGRIFIALLHGRPVGTCALIQSSPGCFELAKMGVDESARGLQIGRRLVDAATQAVKEMSAKEYYLLSSSKLKPAQALYRSAGFVPVPLLPDDTFKYARADVRMVYRLPLNSDGFSILSQRGDKKLMTA